MNDIDDVVKKVLIQRKIGDQIIQAMRAISSSDNIASGGTKYIVGDYVFEVEVSKISGGKK